MNVIAKRTSRVPLILFGVATLALAVALYLVLGNQKSPAQKDASEQAHAVTPEQADRMAARLAERLAKNPNDVDGWAMLGHTYGTLGRFTEAAAAYAKLAALVPNDAQVLADWADVLAMAQRSFDGEPEKIVKRALAADPDNPKALALAGNIAFERKDYARAVRHWERMLALVPPDSELARSLSNDIAEARALSSASSAALKSRLPKIAAAEPAAPAALSGKVDLDPAVQSLVSKDDTVFVFVRAAEGPRMPIAALRKQVRDLPLAFSFDDAASLSPDRRLSSVPRVVVVARISKTGEPTPEPGDIEALSPPLAPGTRDIRLRLGGR